MKSVFKMIGIFMLMMGSFAFGQTEQITKEKALDGATKVMIGIKNSTVTIFNASKSYEDFRHKLIGRDGSCETEEGENLIKKIYEIHYNKVTNDQIYKSQNGLKELTYALKKSVENGNSGGALFNEDTDMLARAQEGSCGCRWFQIGCWFDCVFGPKAGPKLLDALIDILIGLLT